MISPVKAFGFSVCGVFCGLFVGCGADNTTHRQINIAFDNQKSDAVYIEVFATGSKATVYRIPGSTSQTILHAAQDHVINKGLSIAFSFEIHLRSGLSNSDSLGSYREDYTSKPEQEEFNLTIQCTQSCELNGKPLPIN